MEKTLLKISGMHCKSCEILLENEIKKIEGVSKVNANYKKGNILISCNGNIDKTLFSKSIEKAGYQIHQEGFLSGKKTNFNKDLGIAFLIFVILVLLLEQTGFYKLNFSSSLSYSNIYIVLLVGLTAGFSTCMALIGSLILALSANFSKTHPQYQFNRKFTPHLYFNFGRILFFFLFGGIAGFAGSFLQLSSLISGIFMVILSIIMVLLGINLLNIFPHFNKMFVLPKNLFHILKIDNLENKLYSHQNSFILGGLTFFLPCGFTQAMQLYAISTGSFLKGAITMSLFAIGTMPGLLTIGTLSSLVKGQFSRIFFKFAGFSIIALSLLNFKGGLNLTGFNFFSTAQETKKEEATNPNVIFENGYQIVRMNQIVNGYEPDFFTIKKNIPVKWIIDSKEPYSCASSLILPSLNIRKLLQRGENIIEFTPSEKGLLRFTCSMGMYTGTFNVVD